DELADAAATARLFGARHTELRLDRAGFEAGLSAVVDALEEPIATPSTVALYHLCELVAGGVKVALIGQGPDELLGGYTRYLEVRYSLPDELLLAADKLGMRHSLELRVPYLDHEIIEYAGRLPAALKIRRGTRKWLHKRLCRGYLPAEIVRRRKRAFASDVVDRWYRESLTGKVADTLLADDALLYRLLRRDRVRRLVGDHHAGRR